MRKFSLNSRPALILGAILLIVVFLSLRSLWMRGTKLTADHDHGENLIHSHVHTHDGVQRHDHSHWGVQNVTHTHPHQHGHSHSDSREAVKAEGMSDKRKSGLIEVGHVHDGNLQVFWVARDVEGSKCSLSFFVESGGRLDTINPESDSFVGEAFYELKPFGKLIFSKQDDDYYVAALPRDTVSHHQTTVVIPDVVIAGNSFDLKFPLPPHNLQP